MAENAKASIGRPRHAPTLYFIVGFKLLKGVVALLLALKIHRLREEDLPEQFQKLLLFLHLDPEKKFFSDLADRVAEITPANLHWLVAGSILYSVFMLLQAVGLVFRVSWIVWLVIGESCFFIPVELFELVHRPSWVKFFILAVNVLIVWYLFANRARLIKHHHH
jgi:uncharacterized membrane protein (DUF2068 family)